VHNGCWMRTKKKRKKWSPFWKVCFSVFTHPHMCRCPWPRRGRWPARRPLTSTGTAAGPTYWRRWWTCTGSEKRAEVRALRPGPGPSRVLLLVQVSTLKSSRLGRLSPNRQSIMKAWTRSSAQTSASRHLLAHTARCRVITIAKSTIHFSTVRSLQPPTNLSTPRQGRRRAEQKEEKTLFFDSMERIQRGVDEAVPQAAVVVEHQEQEDGVWGGDTGPVRRGGGGTCLHRGSGAPGRRKPFYALSGKCFSSMMVITVW